MGIVGPDVREDARALSAVLNGSAEAGRHDDFPYLPHQTYRLYPAYPRVFAIPGAADSCGCPGSR